MPLGNHAIEVITRRLPAEKIKKRPGKAGMEFSFITPDFVIETLNEAFAFAWDTAIVSNTLYDQVAVVGLELKVVDMETGDEVRKQQFGSCEITRGLGTGEAFKGAASDALKKCATLLGLGLELYQDDDAAGGPSTPPQFKKPATRRQDPSPEASTTTEAPATAPRSAPTGAPKSAPRSAPTEAPTSSSKPGSPFEEEEAASSASLAKPTPSEVPQGSTAPKKNPFSKSVQSSGPSVTQMNALQNIADKKEMSPADLIALAGIVDTEGNPVVLFEGLSHQDAIDVIKKAQQVK